MSAQIIFETAPLGSLIRYRDGQPRPPERHRKKLAAWNGRNGVARFVKTEPARVRPTYTMPASITLREGDLTAGGVIMVVVMRTHLLTSELTFEVVERPAVGACQVLVELEGTVELVHLATDRGAAEAWLARNRYANARIVEITADIVAADVVEGRAA